MRMTPDLEEAIRTRAYERWEREGSPEGRDKEHWAEAERELAGESAAPALAATGTQAKLSPTPPKPEKPTR
jgi:hypothetical protein